MFLCYIGFYIVCSLDRFRISSVGIEIFGVQIKLVDKDEEGNGEVGLKYIIYKDQVVKVFVLCMEGYKCSCYNRFKR